MKTRSIRRDNAKGSAVQFAAYSAGQTLVDERTGLLHKYDWREDVRHREIVLPYALRHEQDMDWARDRHTLWNRAEKAEHRYDSRVAREYRVSFPTKLDLKQRIALTRRFAQALADRYGNAIDSAVHDAREGRARTHHAHLLATTRKVAVDGFTEKTNAELMGDRLRARGFEGTGWDDTEQVRALWDRHLVSALKADHFEHTADRYNPRTGVPYRLTFPQQDYRQELLANKFDINAQRREDNAKSRLTATELLAVQQRQQELLSKEDYESVQARAKEIQKVRDRIKNWFLKGAQHQPPKPDRIDVDFQPEHGLSHHRPEAEEVRRRSIREWIASHRKQEHHLEDPDYEMDL